MARAMWKGSISFGLVTIPVQLLPAVRDHDIHFHLLDKAGCRLRRKLVCPDDDQEVPYGETVRGYEVAPDQYVIVEKEELERLKPEAGRSIHITDFVELQEVDPIYFDRPYHLVPDKGGEHAYSLLLQAMQQTNRAAVASFVMREKQYLAAIRPLGARLCLETMRFADEVIADADLPEIGGKPAPQREIDMAIQLIDALAGPFKPENYHDEYRQRVLALIEEKAQGRKPKLPPAKARSGRVINLMDALRASLEDAGGQSSHKAGPRKPATRKKSTSRRKAS